MNDYRERLEALKPEEKKAKTVFRSRMSAISLEAPVENEINTDTFIVHDRTIEVPQIIDGMVAGDSNSTVITLKLSRYFDGVDLAAKKLEIAYENAKQESGYSKAVALTTVDDVLLVDWTVPSEPAKYQGLMRFALKFSETDITNESIYIWQTKPAELNIEESIRVWYNAFPPDYSFEKSFLNKYDNTISYDDMHDTGAPVLIENREIMMPDIRDITVTKDTQSQIITFKINRYFKGVDLSKKVISIPFINAIGSGDRAYSINVEVTENELSFGWLLDGKVTYAAGQVTFAIEFLGYDEKGNFYVWKTRPAFFMVEDGLFVDSYVPLPDPSWLQKWIVESDQVLKDAKGFAERAETAQSIVENKIADAQKQVDDATKAAETIQEEAAKAVVKIDDISKNTTAELTKLSLNTTEDFENLVSSTESELARQSSVAVSAAGDAQFYSESAKLNADRSETAKDKAEAAAERAENIADFNPAGFVKYTEDESESPLPPLPVDADLLGGHPPEYFLSGAVPENVLTAGEIGEDGTVTLTLDADTLQGKKAEDFYQKSDSINAATLNGKTDADFAATSHEHTGYLKSDSDIELSAKLTAGGAQDLTVAQVRNVIISPTEPADWKHGDLWLKYTPAEEQP